jgi:hypothetical protein
LKSTHNTRYYYQFARARYVNLVRERIHTSHDDERIVRVKSVPTHRAGGTETGDAAAARDHRSGVLLRALSTDAGLRVVNVVFDNEHIRGGAAAELHVDAAVGFAGS